jgi:hypothetical protein
MRSIPRFMFLLLVFPLAFALGCGSDDDSTGPEVNPNTAWFTSATAAPGKAVTVDLMIHNAEPIMFAQLPFKVSGVACEITSVEFSGAFASPLLSNTDEDTAPDRCNTWAALLSEVPAGDHVFAKITFTIDAEAPAGSVKLEDYTYVGAFSLDPDNPNYKHFPNFGNMSGKVLNVDFTDGTITVQLPPS